MIIAGFFVASPRTARVPHTDPTLSLYIPEDASHRPQSPIACCIKMHGFDLPHRLQYRTFRLGEDHGAKMKFLNQRVFRLDSRAKLPLPRTVVYVTFKGLETCNV